MNMSMITNITTTKFRTCLHGCIDPIGNPCLPCFASIAPAHALELRYGSGDFDMGAAAKPFVSMDTSLEVTGNASLNHQTGGWVGSSIDMDGTYRTLEVEAKIKPAKLLNQPQLKNAFVSIGHSRSDWDYDSAAINTPIGSANVPGMFDADFAHDSTWIGAGYDF